MSQELIYTSAPHGLKPGSHGFCTVVNTQGITASLAQRLEALSGYRHVFSPPDPNVCLNPVLFSHLVFSLAGRRCHVLSRVCDAGLDHTQRTNKFAHHVVLDPRELVPGGPAWLLAAPGFMQSTWDGNPQVLSVGRQPPSGNSTPAICRAWEQSTGDAGWGGVLAETASPGVNRTAVVIFRPGVDPLPLLAESLALLPPESRWGVSFCTYFSKLPPGLECQWRCVLEGTPEAAASQRLRDALVIDLGKPQGTAPESPLVQAARTGVNPLARVAVSRQSAVVGAYRASDMELAQLLGQAAPASRADLTSSSSRNSTAAPSTVETSGAGIYDLGPVSRSRNTMDLPPLVVPRKFKAKPKSKWPMIAGLGSLAVILLLGIFGLMIANKTEVAKAEAEKKTKTETEKAEAVKVEAVKVEAAKVEVAKSVPIKPVPIKPVPVKPVPVKPVPVKPVPVKPEPVKPEPIKPEPIKPELIKPEPVKPEPIKPEPAKSEKDTVVQYVEFPSENKRGKAIGDSSGAPILPGEDWISLSKMTLLDNSSKSDEEGKALFRLTKETDKTIWNFFVMKPASAFEENEAFANLTVNDKSCIFKWLKNTPSKHDKLQDHFLVITIKDKDRVLALRRPESCMPISIDFTKTKTTLSPNLRLNRYGISFDFDQYSVENLCVTSSVSNSEVAFRLQDIPDSEGHKGRLEVGTSQPAVFSIDLEKKEKEKKKKGTTPYLVVKVRYKGLMLENREKWKTKKFEAKLKVGVNDPVRIFPGEITGFLSELNQKNEKLNNKKSAQEKASDKDKESLKKEIDTLTKDIADNFTSVEPLAKALEKDFSDRKAMILQYQICVKLHDQKIPLYTSGKNKEDSPIISSKPQ